MLFNESGISGLQISVIFIAFITIPAVLAHLALSGGLFAAGQNQVAICAAPGEAPFANEYGGNHIGGQTHELNDADDAWAASPHVTATADVTNYVEGSASACLKIEDEFSTGLIACHDITVNAGRLDLSNCDSVTFWVRSSVDLPDRVLQLGLGEGDSGNVITELLAIPGGALDGRNWNKVKVNLSGADINYDAVKSISLYAATDPGEVTIWLDIIETLPALNTGNLVKPYMKELVYNPVKMPALSC